jgi:hypothetical protein
MDDPILETPSAVQPESPINIEDSQIKPVSSLKKKTTIVLILLTLFIILILIGGYYYFVFKNASIKSVDISTQTPTIIPTITSDLVTPTIFPSPTSILTDALIKKLSNETVKARTQFDLSTWKTFEDKEVGIRFKYPKEWGIIERIYDTPHCTKENQTECDGYGYGVSFSLNDTSLKNNFYVDGISNNFVRGRGGCAFHGFEKSGYITPSQYCEKYQFVNIYCQPINNGLQVLTGNKIDPNNNDVECNYSNLFTRSFFLDRPTKLITGLRFSGTFLSSNYSFASQYRREDPNNSDMSFVSDLIIKRKLDNESIKNFDEIEKLFETIEEL